MSKKLASVSAYTHYKAELKSDSGIARAAGVSPASVGSWSEVGMPAWAALKISNEKGIPFPFGDYGLDAKTFLDHAVEDLTNAA